MRVRMRVRCEMEMEIEGQQQWKEEVGVMGNILNSDNSGSSEDEWLPEQYKTKAKANAKAKVGAKAK